LENSEAIAIVPKMLVRSLVSSVKYQKTPLIKVCGVHIQSSHFSTASHYDVGKKFRIKDRNHLQELEKLGTFQKTTTEVDIFYDSRDSIFSKRDVWLRNRNGGSFQCKVPMELMDKYKGTDIYLQLNSKEEIGEVLQIYVPNISTNESVMQLR
jgi:hypothetical protein